MLNKKKKLLKLGIIDQSDLETKTIEERLLDDMTDSLKRDEEFGKMLDSVIFRVSPKNKTKK